MTGSPLDGPLPAGAVCLTSCLEAHGNDLVLLFGGTGPAPERVIKVARSTAHGFKIANEHRVLDALSRDPGLASLLPTPCELGSAAGRPFLVQRGIAGRSLFRRLREGGLRGGGADLVRQGTDLLARIHASEIDAGPSPSPLREWAAATPREVAGRLATEVPPAARLDELEEIFGALGGARVPLQHGDYWPANLLVDPAGTRLAGVVDWELASGESRLPIDLVWYLINVAFSLHEEEVVGSLVPAFRRSFFAPGEVNDVLRDAYGRYRRAAGLEAGLSGGLLPLCLLFLAVRERSLYGRHGKIDGQCAELLKLSLERAGRLLLE